MNAQKLKKGAMYYCLIGGTWYPEYAVIKAKYIGNAGYSGNNDLVFMEQNIDGIIHRFEAESRLIYPVDTKILAAFLHNERQTRRIVEHPKQYDCKDAKEKIFGWIATLLKTDQKALAVKFREHYPSLVTSKGVYLTSKFKVKDWNELLHGYFYYKYPKVKIPIEEEK